MVKPENRRILVVDAPGVLGREQWEALDRELSFDLLRIGVEEAISEGAIRFVWPHSIGCAAQRGNERDSIARGRR